MGGVRKGAAALAFALLIPALGALPPAPAMAQSAATKATTAPDPRDTETAALTTGLPEPVWGAERPRSSSVTLPQPLSAEDEDRYREIFALQENGDWGRADKLIRDLDNRILMGHVLFQRLMHPTAYRSKYKELKAWMDQYADHPEADRIYNLALKRRPANWKYPDKPRAAETNGLTREDAAAKKVAKGVQKPYRSRAERAQIRSEQRRIRYWVQRGRVTASLDHLNSKPIRKLFDQVSMADSLGVVARGYFRYDYDEKAVDVAAEALKLAPEAALNAAWWGGLAAFRQEDYGKAASFFVALSEMADASPHYHAAGAFWASRAYLLGGKPEKVNPMLQRAAEVQRSFYGLLALGALGLQPSFDWELVPLSQDELSLLRRIPAANRAMALIQIGEITRAEAELKRIMHALPVNLARVLLGVADEGGLADLAFRVGADLERRHGLRLDAALYPTPGFEPRNGFQIDRAFLYALIRQESRFRPDARSHAGASGLMQLMPSTAGFVAQKRFTGHRRNELLDPAYNMELGQKYVQMLLDDRIAGKNLLYTLTAYNGGPGNLQKWRAKITYNNDPLLFLEAIPSRETRIYVENVLANLWIYRHRLQQRAPSLHALLAGNWPVYIAQDDALKDSRIAGLTGAAD